MDKLVANRRAHATSEEDSRHLLQAPPCQVGVWLALTASLSFFPLEMKIFM